MTTTAQDPNHYLFPAEWSQHEATWLAWPHYQKDWPGRMNAVEWTFVEMAKKLSPHEYVYFLVNDPTEEVHARRLLQDGGVNEANLRFFTFPTERAWCRDYGPTCVKDAGGRRVFLNFKFNAWAKYPDFEHDASIATLAAAELGFPGLEVRHGTAHVTLEGGSLDVNGAGTLLTTRECLLDPQIQVRNPGFLEKDYESVFRKFLGISQTIWLNRGIAGDDTHGHVDDLCRFVNAETVVLCEEKRSDDANYMALAENREILQGVKLASGAALKTILLPMPQPLYFRGIRLPASYANFYIANGTVLVPTFNDPSDRIALGILAECFPDREICGIHAIDLVVGYGAVHCLTQQLPA